MAAISLGLNALTCSISLVTSAVFIDVAFQQPADQISTNPSDAVAANAVDGDPSTFAQTENQYIPYWYVDLGESILVDHLQVTHHHTQRKYFWAV